jgi:8-oxo-dGTP diphosphatase
VIETDYIPVVCAIIEKNKTILAAKRNSTQTNAGLWEFPGGKVDTGETPSEALHRELLEELNATVRIIKELPPVYHIYPWISIQLIPFVCELISNDIINRERIDMAKYLE